MQSPKQTQVPSVATIGRANGIAKNKNRMYINFGRDQTSFLGRPQKMSTSPYVFHLTKRPVARFLDFSPSTVANTS
jgi:hypothetical protein